MAVFRGMIIKASAPDNFIFAAAQPPQKENYQGRSL
jgi:hypothetical protein